MKTLIFLSWLVAITWGSYYESFQMENDPGFITNDTVNFRQSDTTFYDYYSRLVSGVYKARTVVGNAAFASLDLRPYVYMNSWPDFQMEARIYVDKLTLYSMIFIGLTDSSFMVPYKGTAHSAIMVGLGRAYDGPLFGLYASSGMNWYMETDTAQIGLLAQRRSYLIRLVSNNGALYSELRDAATQNLLMSRELSYSSYDLYNRKLFFLTIGNGGYTSENGNGFADIRIFVDSVLFVPEMSTIQTSAPASPSANPGLRVFPNPCRGEAVIHLQGFEAKELTKSHIGIFDIRGRQQMVIAPSNFEKSVSGLRIIQKLDALGAGIYILRLQTPTKRYSAPLFIRK